MKRSIGRRPEGTAGAVVLVVLFALAGLAACSPDPRRESTARVSGVTPVVGSSWLQHLGLSLGETKMGQNGDGGSPPDRAGAEPAADSGRDFAVTGNDLYRVDCRSCHGPDGTGAPPEINSLVPAVQGTSALLLEQHMKSRGRTLPPEFVANLTVQAKQALRDRLAHGGKKMPPFTHLGPNEVTVLIAYLKRLAHVPDAPPAGRTLNEPAVLVGEHLANGTCHICHPATGGTMMTMSREVPSLAGIGEQLSEPAIAAKVLTGRAPMGMMGMMSSRMPIFSYLSEQEVDAAYLYLQSYPPQ